MPFFQSQPGLGKSTLLGKHPFRTSDRNGSLALYKYVGGERLTPQDDQLPKAFMLTERSKRTENQEKLLWLERYSEAGSPPYHSYFADIAYDAKKEMAYVVRVDAISSIVDVAIHALFLGKTGKGTRMPSGVRLPTLMLPFPFQFTRTSAPLVSRVPETEPFTKIETDSYLNGVGSISVFLKNGSIVTRFQPNATTEAKLIPFDLLWNISQRKWSAFWMNGEKKPVTEAEYQKHLEDLTRREEQRSK